MCKNKAISSRTLKVVALYKEVQDMRTRNVDLTQSDTGFSDEYKDLCESIADDIESLDIQVQTLLGQSFLRDIEILINQPESDHLSPEQFAALL